MLLHRFSFTVSIFSVHGKGLQFVIRNFDACISASLTVVDGAKSLYCNCIFVQRLLLSFPMRFVFSKRGVRCKFLRVRRRLFCDLIVHLLKNDWTQKMLKAIFALQNEVVQVVVQVVSRQGKFVSCFLKLSISLVRNWSTHVVVLQKASLFFLSACRFVPVNFRLPKIPPLSTN